MKHKSLSSKHKQGFGVSSESIDSYISNFLKQSPYFTHSEILFTQHEWLREFTLRTHEYSLDDLLQCEHRDLSIDLYPNQGWISSSDHHLKSVIHACNGFWFIVINKNMDRKIYDFTICVNVGGSFLLHPVAIAKDISRKYGTMIFKEWRSMILDDIQSLKRLVEVVRAEIDFIVPSIVTCPSSRRLCERVGIPVKYDVAFLFPSSYS